MKPEPVFLPKPGSQRKSPTERTLDFFRKRNCVCGIVERRNPKIRNKTHDLFGIIDIIVLTTRGILGVQSTGTDYAGHLAKLTQSHATASARWLQTPGNAGLMLISWRKVKAGTPTLHWRPRIQMITMENLIPALQQQKISLKQTLPGQALTHLELRDLNK